jgi:hypothetical protein
MKLKTAECIHLLNALSLLDGAQRVITGPNGKPHVVIEPYDLTDKVKWNTMKNRRKLRDIVELVEEEKRSLITELTAFKNTLNKEADPKENEERVAAKTDEVDLKLAEFLKQENDVDLLKIPAVGLKLKVNRIMPSTLEKIMDLIDGTPEFDDAPAKPAGPPS